MRPSAGREWAVELETIISDIMPYLASPDIIVELARSSASRDDLRDRAEASIENADAIRITDLRILIDRLDRMG